jgi:hypothetical protein
VTLGTVCVLCRHQFYVNIRNSLVSGFLRPETSDQAASIAALLAQLDVGDADKMDSAIAQKAYCKLLDSMYFSCSRREKLDVCAEVCKAHLALKGITSDVAKYRLMQAVCELPTFGLHCYNASVVTVSSKKTVNIAICSDGIILFDHCWKQIDR